MIVVTRDTLQMLQCSHNIVPTPMTCILGLELCFDVATVEFFSMALFIFKYKFFEKLWTKVKVSCLNSLEINHYIYKYNLNALQ